jgi:hypothetical protein
MQPFIIYFNEKCLSRMPEKYHWETGVKDLCNTIDDFFSVRPDAGIAFPAGKLQFDCGGLPLSTRIKEAYPNRDKYRKLLTKIRNLPNLDIQLLKNVYWEEKLAHGLTLADSINSWAVSLFLKDTHLALAIITVQRYELDEVNDKFIGPNESTIKHLSTTSHTQQWIAEIRDWGATVASSCTLEKINGYPVVMYQGPKEHNPPHVHLLDKKSGASLAKYEIEEFSRIKGPPTWDADMKIWIAQYRDQLLKSWARCQQGGLHFIIKK